MSNIKFISMVKYWFTFRQFQCNIVRQIFFISLLIPLFNRREISESKNISRHFSYEFEIFYLVEYLPQRPRILPHASWQIAYVWFYVCIFWNPSSCSVRNLNDICRFGFAKYVGKVICRMQKEFSCYRLLSQTAGYLNTGLNFV